MIPIESFLGMMGMQRNLQFLLSNARHIILDLRFFNVPFNCRGKGEEEVEKTRPAKMCVHIEY